MCSTFCCLYSLKAENQFHLLISFLPAFVLYTCRGSRPVTFIHHLCTSSLTVFRLLPGITRLIFFNLLKKKPTSLQRSYQPGLIWNLPRVIVQLFPQMYNSKSFGKSKRVSERESMTKDSGDGKKRVLRMTRSVPVIAVICYFLAACNTYKP